MRYPPTTYSSICYRRLSDVRSQTTPWLWRGWLALGKLTILEGDPGLGKSLVTLDLCARLTTGRPWPDGAALGTPANAVILNAEDNIEDTVRPRLQALGGDADRVFHLDAVVDKKGEESIRFPAHILALRDLVHQMQARLVVIDPFVSFLDRDVQTHHERSVRAVLALLKDLAEEEECAVLLVRHLNKDEQQRALYRGGASIGFLAAARCGWLIAADPQRPGDRVLAQVKNNMQALAPSLSFGLSETGGLSWHGISPHTVDQLLERKRRRGRPAMQRERATENLKLYMEEAPRRIDEIRDFAQDQKISERTLDRIKQTLGIRSVRAPDGDGRATFWLLPGQLPENVTEEMLTPIPCQHLACGAVAPTKPASWFCLQPTPKLKQFACTAARLPQVRRVLNSSQCIQSASRVLLLAKAVPSR